MAKKYFFDPNFSDGLTKQFLVTNSEIWQKSSKGTNLGTTFMF